MSCFLMPWQEAQRSVSEVGVLACLGLLPEVVSCLVVNGFWSFSADYGVYVHSTNSYTSVDAVEFLLRLNGDYWARLHVMNC